MDAEFKSFQEVAPEIEARLREDGKWVRNRTENPAAITQFIVSYEDRANAAAAGYAMQMAIGKITAALKEWQTYPQCSMDVESEKLQSAVAQTGSTISLLTGLTFDDGWRGEGAEAYGRLARNNITQLLAVHSAGIKCRDSVSSLVSFCEIKLAKVLTTLNDARGIIDPVVSHVASNWHPYEWIAVCNNAAEQLSPMGETIRTALSDCKARFESVAPNLKEHTSEMSEAFKAIQTPSAGVWDR